MGRAVAVHSLVADLKLDGYGSMAIENNRSLTPEQTIRLLRDLLRVYDASFEPMRMSELSKLECGFVRKTGEYIWASRAEIEARNPEIQLRTDYVSSGSILSSAGTAVRSGLENGRVSKSNTFGTIDSLPVLDQSRVDPTPSSLLTRTEARLCILGVENLRSVRLVGTQSPYCKWLLLDPSGQEVASGRTQKHVNGGRNPNWSSQPFLTPLPKSMTTLKGCTISFTVRTPTAISSVM